MSLNNFEIKSEQPISKLFLERKINNFNDACLFIKNLAYARNENKNDLTTIFVENCGTCSTKHAILKELAIENNADVKLKLGIFKMNQVNTPAVAKTLDSYKLLYIPEAHNYLSIDYEIIDCTKINSSKEDFIKDLMIEIEIQPNQITNFKINYHQNILKKWLVENPDIGYSFKEIWDIREKCIADLSI